MYAEFLNNSIAIPSDATDKLCRAVNLGAGRGLLNMVVNRKTGRVQMTYNVVLIEKTLYRSSHPYKTKGARKQCRLLW